MSTFTTERLKQLVAYVIKGAGFKPNFELSDKIGIRVRDGVLYLNTTDGTNYLSVSDRCVSDNFDIVVNAEVFSKLIGKITSETVDIIVVDDTKLEVTGNGKYTLELVPSESGELLSFPDKFPENTVEKGTISASDIVAINTTLSASLSNKIGSIYTNYYFGEVVASTDRAMMAIFNRKLVDDVYLFNKEFVELMTLSGAEVSISQNDNVIVAESSISEHGSIRVCTILPTDVDKFEIDGIRKFVSMELTSFCRIRKAEILALLDRLSLFVSDKFDDGAIILNFKKEYVEVSSLASSGVERIEYTECKEPIELQIKINIDRLRDQLKSYTSDMVDLYYGSDLCIKLVDGDMTQLIALMK
jgi:hypothetical protein